MTHRERLMTVLRGELPDRLPWVPRIQLWYNSAVLNDTLPARFRGMSLREVERAVGIGSAARDGAVFRTEYDGDVELVTRTEDGKQVELVKTPVGTVRTVTRRTRDLEERGLPGRVEEYPLKGPADYRVWEYVVEHSRYVPDYDLYKQYDREIGDDGLPMVSAGDVPFHEFLLKLAGYESAFYQLADHAADVEHLLAVMTEVQRERLWPVLLDSPASLILHGLHLSSQFTPPDFFRRSILPYYREFVPLLHERGKSLAMHADNDTSQILDLLEEAGWDVLECFVTAPMVPLTLSEARRRLGDRVILWGGIPSSILSPSVPEDRFRGYVEQALRDIAPGGAFILGVADNVMPDSIIERVEWISEVLKLRGSLPLGQIS